jgi:hypothetical protein
MKIVYVRSDKSNEFFDLYGVLGEPIDPRGFFNVANPLGILLSDESSLD